MTIFAKTCFALSVGVWSARTGTKDGFLIAFLGFYDSELSAHNRSPVGSSPASATIKEPGIDTKSVPGLFFFIRTFTPKSGVFSNFATHFDFRCPAVVLLPAPRITKSPYIALLIR